MHTRNSHGASRPSFHGNRSKPRSPFSYSHRSGSRAQGAPGPRKFSRPAFSQNRFSKRGKMPAEKIDPTRFVNRAVPAEADVPFTPENRFEDFPIHETLKQRISEKNYTLPTPIQDKAIPHVLEGSDVVGIAQTGTGKTGAFLIPLVHKVLGDPKQKVLIIVPTRELALQIDSELRGFTRSLGIYSVSVVGGMNINRQMADLRRSHHFVIGTPGRLKDHVTRKTIRLAEFATVVLDEADRMLDMGFVNDMRMVMNAMPKERHTLFFSATLSQEIEKLIGEFLRNPVHISLKTRDTSKNVDQDVVRIERGRDKIDVLHELLQKEECRKVLVFGRTKHGVEKLSKILARKGVKAESIHGNKSQSQRQRSLSNFKENRAQVLVATDVAARGLDIPDVSHVINFDLPSTYDDYVHRIGRTGRGNKKGKALTFIEH